MNLTQVSICTRIAEYDAVRASTLQYAGGKKTLHSSRAGRFERHAQTLGGDDREPNRDLAFRTPAICNASDPCQTSAVQGARV
jgi:hypothetical protein